MFECTVHVRALRIWKEVNGEKRQTPASWTTIRRFTERKQIVPNLQYLRWVMQLPRRTAIMSFLPPSIEKLVVVCEPTSSDSIAETGA